MKVTKGAFNVNCSTTKEPVALLTDMFKSLDLNQVQYKLVSLQPFDPNRWVPTAPNARETELNLRWSWPNTKMHSQSTLWDSSASAEN